jgi:hypothetical protein
MKKVLLLLSFFTFCTTAFSQIPNYVPQNGLVGWWPFNGNANDESGNGNNCYNELGIFDVDRFGNSNSSFYGNGLGPAPGSGMYISNLNNFPFGNSNRSISLWFKTNLPFPGGIREFFAYGDNTTGTRFGLMLDGASIGLEYMNGSVFTNFTPDNLWHNLIVTYSGNGSSGIQLFLDGVIMPTNISNPVASFNTLNSFIKTIGRLNDIYNFSGFYDDIGIWNRALTECEIQDLYQAQLNSVSQSISAGADQSICAGDNVTLSGAGGSNYQWNNNVVDGQAFAPAQSNAYVVTAQDTLGCTGTDTVVVTVLENATSTLTETALDSYTLNGQTYTQSGTYTQTLTAANGCDSTITLNLTLNFTGIDELGTNAKKLVNITDLNGKTIPRRKNTLMLFIYEDGTVERVVEMEE